MRKIFLTVLFGLTMFSCKKDKDQKCYHCIFGENRGVRPEPIDYCGDDGGTRRFRDADGNDLSSQCLEK